MIKMKKPVIFAKLDLINDLLILQLDRIYGTEVFEQTM